MTSKRLQGLIDWMDELVTDKHRDERKLFGIWQSLKAAIRQEEAEKE